MQPIAEYAEYAQLAQQCYYVPKDTHQLPSDWNVIFAPENKGAWDTFYTLYANNVREEIVLCIRGSDKIFNYLADVGLMVAAFKGEPIKVPDVSQVEHLAKYISHFNLNISVNELNTLGQKIKDFDKKVGDSMTNWILALTYIAAISTGLYAANSLADASIVMTIIMGGTVASLSFAALMKLKDEALHKLIKKLESPESRNSIEELGNSLINFRKQHFPNFTFKIVGHSLGGVIAELCAVKVGVECITFESPGAKEVLDKLAEYKDRPRNIINFLSAPNIINTLNHHPGKIYRLKLPHTDNSFSFVHSANCVMQSSSRILTYSSLGMFAVGKALVAKTVGTKLVGAAGKAGLGAIGTKFAGGVVGLWRNINWLQGQHSIDNIVTYFNSSNDPQLIMMKSWPRVYWKNFANTLFEFSRDFVPLQKDKPGIRNIIDEEGMREAQVKRIPEYQESEV